MYKSGRKVGKGRLRWGLVLVGFSVVPSSSTQMKRRDSEPAASGVRGGKEAHTVVGSRTNVSAPDEEKSVVGWIHQCIYFSDSATSV